MDYLRQLLQGLFGNQFDGDVAFAVFVGVSATLVVVALGMLVINLLDPQRRRLKKVTGDFRHTAFAEGVDGTGQQSIVTSERKSSSVGTNGLRLLFMIGLPLLVVGAASFFPDIKPTLVLYGALFAAGLGFIVPGMLSDAKERRRQRELINGFPDALDLLVACTEAGMGLSAAIQRVGDELIFSHPALAQQFKLVNYEISGGVERMQALRNMADRCGVKSIRGLVGILTQTIRYGTSVADTLRVYAEDMRDARMQAAEEEAAKLGTKLIFPLITCIFPSFFLVAIGPAIIGVINALKNT